MGEIRTSFKVLVWERARFGVVQCRKESTKYFLFKQAEERSDTRGHQLADATASLSFAHRAK